eukprot:10813664-Ditylum_brightwellii.AAC.1
MEGAGRGQEACRGALTPATGSTKHSPGELRYQWQAHTGQAHTGQAHTGQAHTALRICTHFYRRRPSHFRQLE